MTTSPAEQVRTFADSYWDRLLATQPLVASSVGDRRFDALLPDLSDDGRAAREALASFALEDVRRLRSLVDEVDDRATLDVIEASAARELDHLAHRLDHFEVASHFGPVTLLSELADIARVEDRTSFEQYLERLHEVPGYLRQSEDVLREAAALGRVMPSAVVARAIAQLDQLLDAPADELPSLAPVADRPPPDQELVLEVLQEQVLPALDGYRAALVAYAAGARPTLGLCHLDGGDAVYAAALRRWTSLGVSPELLAELGRAAHAEVETERERLVSAVGAGAAAEVAAYEGSILGGLVNKQALLDLVRERVDAALEGLDAAFATLPETPCEVRLIDEFREPHYPFAIYQPPTFDGRGSGVFYVNGGNLEAWPVARLAAITHHEAVPGHHLQIALEMEQDGRPLIRRCATAIGGDIFAEGWALYAEGLAEELGLYRHAAELLGLSDTRLLRAVRLEVDTGIHAFGWTRERALDFMLDAGIPEAEADLEIDRYAAVPGQAVSYKVGEQAIRDWRAEALRRGRSLAEFHDELLKLGALTLPALAQELDMPIALS